MTVADAIAGWLEEKEITHGFGIIGAGNIALFKAIEAKGFTKLCCVHHEQAAVMSAGAFYRISGKIALAIVTTGAGSTNAITGVVAAYMDGTPVLVISGNEASKYMYAPTRVWGVQGYDSTGMVSGVTKWRDRAYPHGPINAQLDIAYERALKPPQGPVWIDIPKDVQTDAC